MELPPELRKLKLSDKTLNFRVVSGEVVDHKIWSETKVRGAGHWRSAYAAGVSDIVSDVTEILELFLRTDEGKEDSVRLYNSGVHVRNGHYVSLIYWQQPGQQERLLGVYNRSLDKFWDFSHPASAVREPKEEEYGWLATIFLLPFLMGIYLFFSALSMEGGMAPRMLGLIPLVLLIQYAFSSWALRLIALVAIPLLYLAVTDYMVLPAVHVYLRDVAAHWGDASGFWNQMQGAFAGVWNILERGPQHVMHFFGESMWPREWVELSHQAFILGAAAILFLIGRVCRRKENVRLVRGSQRDAAEDKEKVAWHHRQLLAYVRR